MKEIFQISMSLMIGYMLEMALRVIDFLTGGKEDGN